MTNCFVCVKLHDLCYVSCSVVTPIQVPGKAYKHWSDEKKGMALMYYNKWGSATRAAEHLLKEFHDEFQGVSEGHIRAWVRAMGASTKKTGPMKQPGGKYLTSYCIQKVCMVTSFSCVTSILSKCELPLSAGS